MIFSPSKAECGLRTFRETKKECSGGLTRENGQRFRDLVLSRGNTLDYGEMYRAFIGHDPEVEAMLEYRGLTEVTQGE